MYISCRIYNNDAQYYDTRRALSDYTLIAVVEYSTPRYINFVLKKKKNIERDILDYLEGITIAANTHAHRTQQR